MNWKETLTILADGESLSETQAHAAFADVMAGTALPEQLAALLGMIQARGSREVGTYGATADELVGAARAMREKAVPVTVPEGMTAIDTCGTGGDHAGTFNISTAAAFVVAGAGRGKGVCVAKHGNRAVTSQSGSSQVLEALGVNLSAEPAQLTRCMQEAGIAFLFAPNHHPAMRHAAAVRKNLGFRSIFNMVGPMTNPAGVRRQLIGVWDKNLMSTMSEAMYRLGVDFSCLVHGHVAGYAIDEPSPFGQTLYDTVEPSATAEAGYVPTQTHREGRLEALADIGVLQVKDAAASATLIQRIFAGDKSTDILAAREMVVEAAAVALWVSGKTDAGQPNADCDFASGYAMAIEALDNGAAANALKTLQQLTHEATV